MKIYLRDRNKTLCDIWNLCFKNEPDVEISYGDIFDDGPHMSAEAIVSPANSYGFMNGGIDQAYTDYFGEGVQQNLQYLIDEFHYGELNVGQAQIVPTNNKIIPYLISAPTMRVPQCVDNTDNVYLAFRAALIVSHDNNFSSILCPGMGCGVGRLPYNKCAAQMFLAYKSLGLKFTNLHAASVYHASNLNRVI